MDERDKIGLIERMIAAWNSGDLEGCTAEFSDDFEYDLRRSDVPGEMEIFRGREEFLAFAGRWQEMLGPTPVRLEQAQELADGRLFVLYRQRGTGKTSGAGLDYEIVQIHSFEGSLTTGAEVFLDLAKGRAAAGLDQDGTDARSVEANLALARRGYEVWNEAGLEGMLAEVWAADIVFHEIPQAANSGVFHGAEALAAHARELVELGGHFRIDVRSLECRGPYVLAALEQTFTGSSSGVGMTGSTFHVARWEGERVQELRAYVDGEQARRDYERLAADA